MITYPLNNIDYTAEDAELYFSTRESGVYDGNDFQVTVSGIDNNVTVDTGIAWIHNTKFSGKVVALKEPKTLTLSLPNSVYDRIDSIVIQFDANENATEIVVKEGIASSAPIAPNVVRTESLYELHIFHVRRKAGATVISIDDLVDLRNDSDYCGIMFDPISSVDPTLTKNGYAADAAETGKQIKRATNVRNLLDNSYFTNPVNQRGQTRYDTDGYSIDRWRISGSGGTGAFALATAPEYEYVGLLVNQGYLDFYQQLERFPQMRGNVYTVAVQFFGNNTIHSYSAPFVMGETSNEITFGDSGVGFYSVESQNILFRVDAERSNGGINILHAAIYEGEYTAETLPPYAEKGYGAELLECQRYYQKYQMLVGEASPWALKRIYVNVRPVMRIKPTATVTHTGTGTPSVYVRADQTLDITCSSGYADTNIALSADL